MPKLSYDNVTMLDNMTRQCDTVMSPDGHDFRPVRSEFGNLEKGPGQKGPGKTIFSAKIIGKHRKTAKHM